jgi:RimJ/RimL family protein N-acetyltransferase/predicted enzyme related to lactoylglutathione lyase
MVSLLVRDYDEAIAFYAGTLGWDVVENRALPEQKRWVVLAPHGSGARLLFARASTPEQQACVGNQTGGRVGFFLETDNFWRDYRTYQGNGVEFVRPPKNEPYGTVAVFKDLYGNLWDLVQPRESSVVLERAHADDAPAFASLEQDRGVRPFITPCDETRHREAITAPDTVYLRILDRDGLAGFIVLVLGPDEKSVEFRRIVVARRGRGIGQGAIAQMERHVFEVIGRSRVWLDVLEENERARHIYEKLGYSRFGSSSAGGRRLLLYEKRL